MNFSSEALKQFHKKQFTDILDSIRGPKTLFLDKSLSGPLSVFMEWSTMKERMVERMFYLENGNPPSPDLLCDQVLYFLPSHHLLSLQWVIEQIKRGEKKKKYYLYLIPKRNSLAEKILEDEGIYGELFLGDFQMDWIPLGSDLWSLEWHSSFSDLYFTKDISVLSHACMAVMKIQRMLGVFPVIHGKGIYSEKLAQMLLLKRQESLEEELQIVPEFDALYIFDRNLDLISPLMTPLTYEALVDSIFHIRHGAVELPAEVTGLKETKKFSLFSTQDPFYLQLRYVHISKVGQILNQIAKKVQQDFEERHEKKTVNELRAFVGKLSNLKQEQQSLKLHIALVEYLTKKYFNSEFHAHLDAHQNLLAGLLPPVPPAPSQLYQVPSSTASAQQLLNYNHFKSYLHYPPKPIHLLLKELSLFSLLHGSAWKKSLIEQWTQWLGQHYGFWKSFQIMQTMTSAGIFKSPQSQPNAELREFQPTQPKTWPTLKTQLNLLSEDVDEKEPKDISYIYSGFAPILPRLFEKLNQSRSQQSKDFVTGGWLGWKTGKQSNPELDSIFGPLAEVMQVLPGNHFTHTQPLLQQPKERSKKRIMILHLGGMSMAEVCAYKFLMNQLNMEVVLLTTEMITGDSLMKQLIHASGCESEQKKPVIREKIITSSSSSMTLDK